MAKILVVEDDHLIRRLYQQAFTFDKHTVLVASDGMDGLEIAKKEIPTIILLDIMMPKMNGLEMLKKLKLDPATKKIL